MPWDVHVHSCCPSREAFQDLVLPEEESNRKKYITHKRFNKPLCILPGNCKPFTHLVSPYALCSDFKKRLFFISPLDCGDHSLFFYSVINCSSCSGPSNPLVMNLPVEVSKTDIWNSFHPYRLPKNKQCWWWS